MVEDYFTLHPQFAFGHGGDPASYVVVKYSLVHKSANQNRRIGVER